MSAALGAYGVWRMGSGITPSLAAQVEELGYGAIWVGGSPRGDLENVEKLLDATERIPVATGIVNMWREDAAPWPIRIAGSARSILAGSGSGSDSAIGRRPRNGTGPFAQFS